MKRLLRVQFQIMNILWAEAELKNTLVVDNVYMLLKKHINKTNSIHNTMKRLEDHGFIEMIGGHYARNQKCKILITKDEYKEKEAIAINKILKKENDFQSRLDKEESVLHNINVESIKESLSYGRGYVYSIQYHIVWTTNKARPILEGLIVEEIKGYLLEILRALEMAPLEIKIKPDYIHIFAASNPQLKLSDAIKAIKGQIARRLFFNHPEFKHELYGGHLWCRSYLAVTPSDKTAQQIKEYINKQKNK